jgi:hypothetical protein
VIFGQDVKQGRRRLVVRSEKLDEAEQSVARIVKLGSGEDQANIGNGSWLTVFILAVRDEVV